MSILGLTKKEQQRWEANQRHHAKKKFQVVYYSAHDKDTTFPHCYEKIAKNITAIKNYLRKRAVIGSASIYDYEENTVTYYKPSVKSIIKMHSHKA